MSHANAALTPRARLRLARLIVEDGWPVARAAERYRRVLADGEAVGAALPAGRCAAAWPTGPRGRTGSRSRTPQPMVRNDRAPAVAASGWVRSRSAPGSACRPRPCTRCWSAAGSTGSVHVDRRTGEPIRRYEHDRPGAMLHVDVKKLGNIPDGGGWRYVGRAQGERNRAATARQAPQQAPRPADGHRVRAHRHRRPLPRRLRRDPRRRDRRHRHRRAAPRGGLVRRPRRHRRTGALRQRLGLPLPRLARRLPRARHHARRGPAPTGRRPTARSNASTAPSPTAGPSPACSPARSARRQALPGWLHEYNHHRPHTAIGNVPPITRLTNLPGQYT